MLKWFFGYLLLVRAFIFAAWHHGRQRNSKNGELYIFHPIRVMRNPRLKTVTERITALFHDLIEDCGVTLDQVARFDPTGEIRKALVFLSKLPEEEDDYEAFIDRVATGPRLAILVKVCDLEDNMNIERIPNPTQKDYLRVARYAKAHVKLVALL